MAEIIHKYYCRHCKRFMFGETAAGLAFNVNNHNSVMHPTDCCNWTTSGIQLSANYTGVDGPLPQYLVSHGTTSKNEWGGANPPNITERDKIFLERNLIRW